MIKFIDNVNIYSKKYSFFIGALGFEKRAIYIANELKNNYEVGICFAMGHKDKYDYEKNKRTYDTLKFKTIKWDDTYINEELLGILVDNGLKVKEDTISVLLDISSMTKSMSTKILYNLLEYMKDNSIELTIAYVPGKFKKYETNIHHSQIKYAELVMSEFGEITLPSRPLSVIMGLGYEYSRSIGALAYLDMQKAILFRPHDDSEEFYNEVTEANKDLIEEMNLNNVQDYEVASPYDIFIKLRTLISGLIETNRVAIVPFGPKIFHVMSVLVSHSLDNRVQIWRFSPGDNSEPQNVIPDNKIISVSFKYTRKK